MAAGRRALTGDVVVLYEGSIRPKFYVPSKMRHGASITLGGWRVKASLNTSHEVKTHSYQILFHRPRHASGPGADANRPRG